MGRCSDARCRLIRAVRELFWEQSYGSTTVDAICVRAKVLKGSFYHFFDSKTDLALASLKESREERRKAMDAMFSPLIPPLDRIQAYAKQLHTHQVQLRKEHGCVLGCPLFNLGAEISTQEPKVRSEVAGMLGDTIRYFESAIRDAQNNKELPAGDPALKARCLHAFIEGALTQARITDDHAVLRDLAPQALALLRSDLGKAAA